MLAALAQGYKDWTPGQWGLAVGYVLGAIGTFLLMTFGPWLLKMSREMRDNRRETSEAKTQAALADQKADHANQGVANANNRIVMAAALSTPAADKLATEDTAKQIDVDVKKILKP